MSKIGESPIHIENGVQVTLAPESVLVKGALGELSIEIPRGILVKQDGETLHVERLAESKKVRSLHGLVRSLIANAIKGVTKAWDKNLEVHGTGYKVRMQGKDLIFDVGYSHSVTFPAVEGLTYTADKNKVTISGVNKQHVGEVANKIKSIRRPDPYKGKGIRYEGEVLYLKPGKKAATG